MNIPSIRHDFKSLHKNNLFELFWEYESLHLKFSKFQIVLATNNSMVEFIPTFGFRGSLFDKSFMYRQYCLSVSWLTTSLQLDIF